MSNPYAGRADCCFWSRSVTSIAPGALDPMNVNREIKPTERIATMGSCFAQHISRFVKSMGMNYYVPEAAPAGMSENDARTRGYGLFSARYGNVYSVRQAVQLFDRAFGVFRPEDSIWPRAQGFVDAFRPMVEPQALESVDQVENSREEHLGHVREVFLQSDWLIFTMGLTEAWASKKDGAIYPSAPGVRGGVFDESKYAFVNFSVVEVIDDLRSLVRRLLATNPRLRIILTVSPVPLVATYEDRHVLVSTVHSKSALRAAADAIEREFDQVVYFPSYEIITSPCAAVSYFKDDLRSVNDLGIKHVMRVFARHFLGIGHETKVRPPCGAPAQDNEVLCDEEEIERALLGSGLRPRRQPDPLQVGRVGMEPSGVWAAGDRLAAQSCRVRLEATIPAQIKAGETVEIYCRVDNLGSAFLASAQPYPVYLSYKWISPQSGQWLQAYEGLRSALPSFLAPGTSAWVRMQVQGLPFAGTFRLRITPVQELVAWFDDLAAANAIEADVDVIDL